MQISQRQKLIVAIVAFAASGYIMYNTFWSSPSAPAPVIADSFSGTAGTDNTNSDTDLLGIASEFETVMFDSDLFSSPVFQSLTNSNASVSQEQEGRPNPFAEIGTDRIRQATSTTSKNATKR